MYNVNDIVIYGSNGVCKIIEIKEKNFTGKQELYYVLKPAQSEKSTYFVPLNNEKNVAKMREILSEKEIINLIDSMADEREIWIADDNIRKEKYKAIISEGNHSELIRMIKAIYLEKKRREAKGKKLYAFDERFFKEAEELLYGEFQYVLNLDKEQLLAYIFDRIEKATDKNAAES